MGRRGRCGVGRHACVSFLLLDGGDHASTTTWRGTGWRRRKSIPHISTLLPHVLLHAQSQEEAGMAAQMEREEETPGSWWGRRRGRNRGGSRSGRRLGFLPRGCDFYLTR